MRVFCAERGAGDDGALMDKEIIRNAIRCNHCGDEIESTHRHDYCECKCGKVAVDGGKDYLRRTFVTHPDADYTELSKWQEHTKIGDIV